MPRLSPDITEQAFRAFIRTSGLVRNCMAPYFARFGISGAQWGILRQLHRAEGEGIKSLRLGELSNRLLVRPPSVTTLVDRLERMKLVARTTADEDARAKKLQLTTAGRRLVQRVLQYHPTQIRTMLAGLNEREHRSLYDLMVKLTAHLESLEDGQGKNRNGKEHRK